MRAKIVQAIKLGATWLGLKLLDAAGLPEFAVLDAQLFLYGEEIARGRGTVTVYRRWVKFAEPDERALPREEWIISWYPVDRVAEIYDMENEQGGYFDEENETAFLE